MTTGTWSAAASTSSCRNVVLPELGPPNAAPWPGEPTDCQVHRANGAPVANTDAIAAMGNTTSCTPARNPARATKGWGTRSTRRPGEPADKRKHQTACDEHG
jgi:hypothetical protein